MPQPASHDTLAIAAAQVRHLTEPFRHLEARYVWDRNRNRKLRIAESWHPALLDQLEHAAARTRHGPDTRAGKPGSRMPINADAVDRLRAIHRGIVAWFQQLHHRIHITTGPDDTPAKAALRGLIAAAPHLAPSIADQLCADIDAWWRWAATQAGWNPDDLRKDL